ncbi:MAG: hypothetical protein WCI45_12240 [Desulfuromonadales bacterium]
MSKNQNPTISTNAEILKELVTRLQSASDQEVTSLFRNGSIWIYPNDIQKNTVDSTSFEFYGPRYDGNTHELSGGMLLLIDFNGMAEVAVVETEVNEKMEEDEIEHFLGGLKLITVKEARDILIEAAERDAEIALDDINYFNQHTS